MKCISFWCQAYSVIKQFSPVVGSFSEIVFNSISQARVWSALLLWFLTDANTCLWYRERAVERRGEEKAHHGSPAGCWSSCLSTTSAQVILYPTLWGSLSPMPAYKGSGDWQTGRSPQRGPLKWAARATIQGEDRAWDLVLLIAPQHSKARGPRAQSNQSYLVHSVLQEALGSKNRSRWQKGFNLAKQL